MDPNAGEYADIVEQRVLILEKGYSQGPRVMQRQRLDTKQESKYTEPNKTQVDTMKLTRTQQDTGEDNETGKH